MRVEPSRVKSMLSWCRELRVMLLIHQFKLESRL
jgi:hypothetical protein